MTTPLTLTPGHDADGTAVLKATGEIDMTNSDTFAAAIREAPSRVVVDLTGVEYIDSAGLSVLFVHAEQIEVIVPSILAPVVAFSGLSEVTTVHGLENRSGHP
jgi:anti-sigma B factor antagonist